jgi:hypothetical protein
MLGAGGSNARRSVRIGWPVPSALKSPTTACFYIIIYLAQCTYILELERERERQTNFLPFHLSGGGASAQLLRPESSAHSSSSDRAGWELTISDRHAAKRGQGLCDYFYFYLKIYYSLYDAADAAGAIYIFII